MKLIHLFATMTTLWPLVCVHIVLYQDTPRYNTLRRHQAKSYRGGSAVEGGEESWNLFQLQQHLSRSTSHLPDCSSDVFSGSTNSGRKSRGGSCQFSLGVGLKVNVGGNGRGQTGQIIISMFHSGYSVTIINFYIVLS